MRTATGKGYHTHTWNEDTYVEIDGIGSIFRVTESVGGSHIVLVNGFQWGHSPFDASGCSSKVFPTVQAAILEIVSRF